MPAPRLRDGLPMAPGAFPVVGHLPRAYRGLPAFFRRTREAVGPLFWLSLGFGQFVLVCSGTEALEILRSKSFDSGHIATISPLNAGGSLLGLDGDAHRRTRTALSGPFHPRGLGASTLGAAMAERLAALVDRWAAAGSARVIPDIQEAALDIVFRAVGVETSDLSEWRSHYRALLLANLGNGPRFPGSPAWRAARAKAWIDARLLAAVASVRAAPADGSLLGALVAGRDEEGGALPDQALVDNLRLLLLGGHETIASTLGWIVISLAHDPTLWRALTEEAGPSAEVPTTPEAARAFPFAEALFRETVRSYPPFSVITRRCVEPYEIHGRTVPRGAITGVDLWGVAHDEALFPSPDDFRPSRWLGRERPPTPLEISQFGAGPHFCLGYPLAWLEAVQFSVTLARVLGRAGKRPVLRGRVPEPIYLPTEHPPAKTVVELSSAG